MAYDNSKPFSYGIPDGNYVGKPTTASFYEKDGRLILDVKFMVKDPQTGEFWKNDKGYEWEANKRHWLTTADGAFNERTIDGIKEWAKGWTCDGIGAFYWFQDPDANGKPFGNLDKAGEVRLSFSTRPPYGQSLFVHALDAERGRKSKFDPADFGLLVIDEAHHATSSTYRRCVDWYTKNRECKVLGVTATPDRADEEALGQVFEEVAYEYEILDAIQNGWLVPVEQQMVTVGSLDFTGVRDNGDDLNQGDLAQVMEDERNLQGIAAPTVEICGERRAIVFAATVEQAERLAEILNRYRPDRAAWICGKTDKEDRRRILADFKEGRLQFVVNVGVLTEGFDDAGVQVVVMARPTKSRSLYAQMAGRGTRPAEEVAHLLGDLTAAERVAAIRNSSKPNCLIVDFVGNAGRHKLVSSVDILGGKVSDEVAEEVTRRIREGGAPVDVTAEMEKAKAAIEERKKKEAATRAGLQARAQFLVSKIDPFSAWDIAPAQERGWDRHRHFTAKQGAVLRERIGVDPAKIPYSQGKQLLDEYFRRVQNHYATLKQANYLKRRGFAMPLRMDAAGRMISRMRAWRRRSPCSTPQRAATRKRTRCWPN